MSTATNFERQMLDLINAERESRGLNPLTLELRLNEAAEDHSTWMLEEDVFSHTGINGTRAGDRIRLADFEFSGSWAWAENIAWQSLRGEPGIEDDVVNLHTSLMNSPGHRANILNPDVTYIGIGIELGNYGGYEAVMVTQNFAKTSAEVQLDTGITPPDPVPEPQPAPEPQPEPQPDPEPVPQPAPAPEPTPEPEAPSSTTATSDADLLVLKQTGSISGLAGDDILIGSTENDVLMGASGADQLLGRGGNDQLRGGSGLDLLVGGAGNDFVHGGSNDDILFGNRGRDKLKGGNGDDELHGGGARDRLIGGNGEDQLFGGNGRDYLIGGAGDDTLEGGNGRDTFAFSSGEDIVTDFNSLEDLVNLRRADGITSYEDLIINHADQIGDDVVITDDAGDSLRLENTLLSDVSSDDFLF